MAVRIVRQQDVVPLKLPGRDLQWIADAETIGSEQLSVAIMTCPAGSVSRPVHSHTGVEEIMVVLAGEGEAWVDGETGSFQPGDAVLFPPGSKHQVRNTGGSALIAACIFASPKAATYVTYDEDAF